MNVEFPPFTLDDERHELRRGDVEVHLSLKAYELLRLLVSERPRALAKSEIHSRLWPDSYVSDATLTSLVAEVRHALDEPGRQPRFIRTVHGFGYAFDGDAMPAGDAPATVTGHVPLVWLTCGEADLALHAGENILGRDAAVHVCLRGTSVSKRHARVVVADESVTIEDLGSKNGTFVNDTRIDAPVALGDGDEVRLGTERLTFRSVARPGSTATVASEDEKAP